jgi:sugar diacid utilization regulator
MPTVDALLASPALRGLERVSGRGGERLITEVRVAEGFDDLGRSPPGGFVILGRAASASTTDYRFDMGLRWAGIRGAAAVAAFAPGRWRPTATAADIAERASIALICVPEGFELTRLLLAVLREAGGTAGQALARAETGLAAALAAEREAANLELLRDTLTGALGTRIELRPPADGELGVAVTAGEATFGYLTAPGVAGDMATASRIVLHTAAAVAGRALDAGERARELPVRSRSELLAELLMSDSAAGQDLLARAQQLGVPLGGWHVVVRIEADNLEEAGRDEVHRFELLETAAQAALQAMTGPWHLSRAGRAIVLVWMASSHPGSQAGQRAARFAERALQAISGRLPALQLRAGVGTPHEGPMGLRASAAEARSALVAARAAGRTERVAAHDVTGVRRMLMEWYASETARASVHAQLAPLERLGRAKGESAIRTLAAYLDEQGSVTRTARRLHLHRNAVTYRLRRITDLLGVDLGDPDQRLALQLACRARLLG